MKYLIIYVFSFAVLLVSCTKNKELKKQHDNSSVDILLEIPDTTVDKSALLYNNQISLWTLNEQPYSGYAVSYYPNGTLKEKIGILKGKKENQAKYWHSEGNLREVAHYHKGKLHGQKKVWSSENVLLSHLNYQSGKPDGEQKTWYPTGELHKKLNLNMGKEEGMQQAFRKNGDLYANYEARDGRIFGLKKTSLCYGLEEESINLED